MTRFGRAFYARAKVAYTELDKAKDEVLQLGGARSGQVAIGFGPHAALLLMPTAVQRFQSQFPKVELRLLEGFAHATMPLVRDETLDMALGPRLPGYRPDAALRFRPVFVNDQIVIGRKGHPLAGARSASDLSQAHWISFEPRLVFNDILSRLGLPVGMRLTQCESFNTLVTLVAETDLLTIASKRTLKLARMNQLIEEIPLIEQVASMTTGLYTRVDSPLTPPATAMAKILVEVGRSLGMK